jgi:hypothetical protein
LPLTVTFTIKYNDSASREALLPRPPLFGEYGSLRPWSQRKARRADAGKLYRYARESGTRGGGRRNGALKHFRALENAATKIAVQRKPKKLNQRLLGSGHHRSPSYDFWYRLAFDQAIPVIEDNHDFQNLRDEILVIPAEFLGFDPHVFQVLLDRCPGLEMSRLIAANTRFRRSRRKRVSREHVLSHRGSAHNSPNSNSF